MKYVVALAAIPVVIWAATPRSAPLVAKAVEPEGVTVQRMDATTFRARWSLVSEMPPTKEIIHEPLLLVSHEAPLVGRAHGTPVSRPLLRQVSLRADVCARHGMRKVQIGKRWRCKR